MIEAELFEYLQENLYPDLVKSEGRGDEVSQAHNAER
jgi:hypothetical protein